MVSKNNSKELKRLYDFNEKYDIGTGLGPVPGNINGSLVSDVIKVMLENKNIQTFLKRFEDYLDMTEDDNDEFLNDFKLHELK